MGISGCIVGLMAIRDCLPSQAFRLSSCLSALATYRAVQCSSCPYWDDSQQLLQGRCTYAAHTDTVHMGRFGSVWALYRCVYMPCLLQVPWWQSFIPYLMEALSGFPLSLSLFLKHLDIGFALQRLYYFICELQIKIYFITPDF